MSNLGISKSGVGVIEDKMGLLRSPSSFDPRELSWSDLSDW